MSVAKHIAKWTRYIMEKKGSINLCAEEQVPLMEADKDKLFAADLEF